MLGIDLSTALTRIGRAARPELRFAVGSMHALPLPDGALAGAVSWYSVIHAEPGELPGYLAEFARVLRPGGHLLVAFFEAVSEPVTRYDHTVTPATGGRPTTCPRSRARPGSPRSAGCHASPWR